MGLYGFFQGQDLTAFTSIDVTADRLTSIEVSPGGEFLAAGTGDGGLSLWDLRPLQLANQLTEPLSTFPPDLLAALHSLLEYASLPPAIHHALEYIRLVLQRRFQFDIQDWPTKHHPPRRI